MPLVGNVFAGVIKPGDDSALTMAKAYHPLAWYWLSAIRGHQENPKRETNVINDCKEYKEVVKDSKNFLYESPRIFLRNTPSAEENAASIKEARARCREMRAINQQRFYDLNPIITQQQDSEDDNSVDEEASKDPSDAPNPLLTTAQGTAPPTIPTSNF